MKHILFTFIFILITSLSFGQVTDTLQANLKITQINSNTFIVTHYFPWNSNSMIVQASDKEVVLIDTPYTNEATKKVIEWIDDKLQPKKIIAINTGFHVDNLGGNTYLRSKGIDIYGAEITVRMLKERSEATRKQLISWLRPDQKDIIKAYKELIFTAPNKVFDENKGLTLNVGKLTFDIYYPGESHSPDNLVVYIQESNLLFGGCMIKSLGSKGLGFTGDANIDQWPKSVRQIKERYPKVKIVIPHHGKWGDSKLLDHTLYLLKK
ncbi:MAG: subclass B1 metallo-beta-lactamase [Hyphomicrobiales bacterium]